MSFKILAVTLLTFFHFVTGLAEPFYGEPDYEPADGKYFIEFPPYLKVTTRDVDDHGKVTHVATATDTEKNIVYNAQHVAAFPGVDKFSRILFNSFIRQLREKKYKVTERRFSFGPKKYPACEALVESTGARLKVWLVFDTSYAYSISVGSTDDFAWGPSAQTFFNSFKLP